MSFPHREVTQHLAGLETGLWDRAREILMKHARARKEIEAEVQSDD